MARLAEAAGHEALYLGGGQLGYEQAILEANLNITDVAQRGLAIRSVTELPLILDGATGFGDPMHMHRTIPMAESAGFAAGWPPPRSLRDPLDQADPRHNGGAKTACDGRALLAE